VALGVLYLGALLGCKDLTGSQALPSGVNDPSFYHTPAGALGMRTAALYSIEQMLDGYVTDVGLLTDELTSSETNASQGILLLTGLNAGGSYDERILPELSASTQTEVSAGDYSNLQGVRANIAQALGALAAYDTSVADTGAVKVRRGELYALLGYDEILLADLFCSGVPLSTFDFGKDFTYHAGSTTAQVYQDAIVQEDSALALVGNHSSGAQVRNLALVLQGRALLNLGQYAQASQAVSAVPDQFQYQLAVKAGQVINQNGDTVPGGFILGNTVADREGFNGLPFVTGGDPRTVVIDQGLSSTGTHIFTPARYNLPGFNPFVVGDWIEARLIQSEAALQVGDTVTWLALLNQLRATATVVGQQGTLGTLSDPGSSPNDSARVALTFQERAYWLFLTGHRQGDMRRLLRQYRAIYTSQEHVYPTGQYTAPGNGVYGSDVTAAIPHIEEINPNYHGCKDRSP
jgi:hypothetical protein